MAKVICFPAEKIAKGIYINYPEMGERKVNAQIEATLSHYGKHYYIDTPLELKGRGIVHLGVYTAERFSRPSHKVGWNEYKVTATAFEKLKQQYSISMERYLD